jgi:hypothetical protein
MPGEPLSPDELRGFNQRLIEMLGKLGIAYAT